MFGEHDAGKFVRESHGAERKFLAGAVAEFFGKTIGVSTEENDFASAAVALLCEPLGKFIGVRIFSGSVEENDGGGAVGVEDFESGFGVAQFGDGDLRVAADAFDVIIEEAAEGRTPCFPEH